MPGIGKNARRIHGRGDGTERCPVCGDQCAVKMANELFWEKKGKKE